MTKSKKRLDINNGQMSLFDVIKQEMESAGSAPVPGSLNIKYQIIAALIDAVSCCNKSREQICDEMTAYLGEEVTIHMLNAYIAQSKENHRFPLEFTAAFCRATDSLQPLDVVSRACGVFAMRGPDALRADIRKIEEKKQAKNIEAKALEAEKRRLETLLQEVEGR